jgi:hypothetical protein
VIQVIQLALRLKYNMLTCLLNDPELAGKGIIRIIAIGLNEMKCFLYIIDYRSLLSNEA